MKLSINWLKEILPGLKNVSENDIITALEQIGYEIEDVRHVGHDLKDVKVVKVLEVNKHPSADRLSICKLTDGTS